MKRRLWVSVTTLVLLAAPTFVHAQRAPDPRVADLVQAGRVRMALFPPQYTKDNATGELKGVWADVARALAAHIGVQPVLIEHPTPPKMVECLKAGACDVGFLGYDPARAADVEGFSPPFIEFDYTYLVPARSPIRSVADAVVVAKGQAARLAYISEFIEEIKASGFVQQSITRSGWRGVRVAPPASPHAQK
jgi:ABC-type amino acid transport substrate-binding protein